jgi:hypothetical protein
MKNKLFASRRFLSAFLLVVLCLSLQSCHRWKCKREHKKHLAQLEEGVVLKNNNCIPVGCGDVQNCDNPFCQETIRECHRIDEGKLIEMVERFKTPMLLPKRVSAAALRSKVDNGDCRTEILKLTANENDDMTNEDITYNVEKPFDINYSVSFFKGVLQLEPDSFYFYKAKKINADGNEEYDIVFKAFSDEMNFYGDLSDIYP